MSEEREKKMPVVPVSALLQLKSLIEPLDRLEEQKISELLSRLLVDDADAEQLALDKFFAFAQLIETMAAKRDAGVVTRATSMITELIKGAAPNP